MSDRNFEQPIHIRDVVRGVKLGVKTELEPIRHKYDIKDKMGYVLKDKFNFNLPEGILGSLSRGLDS